MYRRHHSRLCRNGRIKSNVLFPRYRSRHRINRTTCKAVLTQIVTDYARQCIFILFSRLFSDLGRIISQSWLFVAKEKNAKFPLEWFLPLFLLYGSTWCEKTLLLDYVAWILEVTL